MRIFNFLAFDEIIAGTASTWYTPASQSEAMGWADSLELFAVTTAVSGTSPTLTCAVQHSGDSRNWLNVHPATPEINQQATVTDRALAGGWRGISPVLLKFVRVNIALGGTSPRCRLKLYMIGRAFQYLPPDKKAPCGCS